MYEKLHWEWLLWNNKIVKMTFMRKIGVNFIIGFFQYQMVVKLMVAILI